MEDLVTRHRMCRPTLWTGVGVDSRQSAMIICPSGCLGASRGATFGTRSSSGP